MFCYRNKTEKTFHSKSVAAGLYEKIRKVGPNLTGLARKGQAGQCRLDRTGEVTEFGQVDFGMTPIPSGQFQFLEAASISMWQTKIRFF